MAIPLQDEFWQKQEAQRWSIIARLEEIGLGHLAAPIRACRTEARILTCRSCFRWHRVFNECGNRFCPHCAVKRSRLRAEELLAWSKTLTQPKHVVLTSRNVQRLTRYHVARQLKAIRALLRSKLAREWESGCWTMEITNESRGWHLHFHILAQARWVDASALSVKWAKLCKQRDAAIIKVKDARAHEYLKEVTKYVVETSELASWNGCDIAELMLAMKGRRSFAVFGKAYGARSAWKKAVMEQRRERMRCDCGACDWQNEPELVAEGILRRV